jgi:hypothetical protein
MPDSIPPTGPPEAPPAPPPRRSGRRISSILEALPGAVQGERISFGDLVDAFDSRAFGPLIVVFAAPNILPVALPGISAVLGAPLILLAWQLMLGRSRPWLPGILRRRSLARRDFERLVARIVPRLQRIERMIRPRLLLLTGATGKRLVGAAALLLSMIVFLPVPFGNAIPGVALVLLAVGLHGRDGGAELAGLSIGLVGVVVVWGFIWGIMEAALLIARSGLGF